MTNWLDCVGNLFRMISSPFHPFTFHFPFSNDLFPRHGSAKASLYDALDLATMFLSFINKNTSGCEMSFLHIAVSLHLKKETHYH
jgi:hypothetical protein